MGIQGLLPLLKSIQKPCNLKTFAGKTLAVDAYGWLHRGAVACAIELAQGKPTTKFVDFAMHRVRMLIHFGVKPYLVFDGDYLPSKAGTEKSRSARRRQSRAAGLELLQMGRSTAAQQELQKAVDVTPEMARQLIEELKKMEVDYVVAPYEADAQMAYLESRGLVDGILSEDSDLLVFGTECLVTKLDQYGDCVAIYRDDFTSCKDISLVGWSNEEFRWMAILSGCDYLPGIDKMGLKTAYRLLRKHKNVERLVRAVQFEGKMKVPSGYLEDFKKAEEAFLYQWVFCPISNKLVNLTEPATCVDVHAMPHVGRHVPANIAWKVAKGNLHPHTKEPLMLPSAFEAKRDFRHPAMKATPELKKHHSIESFFKPKRTPLQELDPNSFTPSPSQQQLLIQQQLQQQVRWTAEPINFRPAVNRSITDLSRSQPARRAISLNGPSTKSKSPKRQRLCSDITPDVGGKSLTSKFFSTPKELESPSVRKGKRTSSGKANDITIWSDDSIEEAMSQIPDPAPASKHEPKKRGFAVFKDNVLGDPAEATINVEHAHSQSVDPAATVVLPPQEPPVDSGYNTQATATMKGSQSQPTPTEEKDESVFTEGLSSRIANFRKEFSFSLDNRTTASATVESQETNEPVESNAEDAVVPCSSPIQEQGQEPVDGLVSYPKLPAVDHITTRQESFADEDWADAGKSPIKPLTSKQEMRLFSNPTLKHKGSEDLLVPDSEGEDEDETLVRRPSFGLDISQFAFAG